MPQKFYIIGRPKGNIGNWKHVVQYTDSDVTDAACARLILDNPTMDYVVAVNFPNTTKVRWRGLWPECVWCFHNVVAHPASHVLYMLGWAFRPLQDLGDWVHNITIPK